MSQISDCKSVSRYSRYKKWFKNRHNTPTTLAEIEKTRKTIEAILRIIDTVAKVAAWSAFGFFLMDLGLKTHNQPVEYLGGVIGFAGPSLLGTRVFLEFSYEGLEGKKLTRRYKRNVWIAWGATIIYLIIWTNVF